MLEGAGLTTFGDYAALAARGDRVSTSRSSETHRVHFDDKGETIIAFHKRYDYTRRRRWRWRRDKALIESRNYELMRSRCDVGVPVVLARGVRSRGLRHIESFILTREIKGASRLDAAASAAGGVPRALQDCLTRDVARMHDAGFFHIDLQWRNILVGRSGGGDALYFLDSTRGGLRRTAVTRAHGRARDLSSLHKDAKRWIGPRDELRWLKAYLGRPLTAIDRAMIRTILRDRAVKDRAPAA